MTNDRIAKPGARVRRRFSTLRHCGRQWCTGLQTMFLRAVTLPRKLTPPAPFKPEELESVLFVRLDRIGDMVLTTPMFQAVKNAFPDCTLQVLCAGYGAAVIENNPCIDRILALPDDRKSRREMLRTLRGQKPDLVIDPSLDVNPASALLSRRLSPKYSIGFAVAGKETLHSLPCPAARENKHLTEHHEDLLQRLGCSARGTLPRIYLTDDEKTAAQALIEKHGLKPKDTIVALHPGGHYASQRWFPDRFAAVADALIESPGVHILIFQGPGDSDDVAKIQKAMRGSPVVMPPMDFRSFMACLSMCDLLLCNNSGPLHIAAALGVPTVSTMGPTLARRWWPVGPNHIVLRKELKCMPCKTGTCQSLECMNRVKPKEMTDGAREFLSSIETATLTHRT
ncbi:MAG: glycosyltransferase family 9 protein [Kiritimatiellia bacterium]